MSDPLISILIPAFRAGRYITETLSSVRAQTYPHWEVLVCEDGISDDTAALVATFAGSCTQPVRLFQNATNRGVSHARNQLMQESRGEFVAFLDADDVWDPDHLATAVAKFSAGADVTFSGVTFIDADGRVIPGAAEPSAADLADIAPAMFRYNFVQCTSTVCLRRDWITRVGGFDPTLSHGEDLDLWLRLLAAGAKWRYTGRTSCAYRKHPASAMGQIRLATARLTAFYEKQLNNPIVPYRERRRVLIENLWSQARFSWRDEPAAASAAFRRIAQLQPWNLAALGGWVFAVARGWFVRPATTSVHRS